MIDLRFDNDDLSKYLPANLNSICTWVNLRINPPEHIATAIKSLHKVVVYGTSRRFVWTVPKAYPSKLRFSTALQVLADAGIEIETKRYC